MHKKGVKVKQVLRMYKVPEFWDPSNGIFYSEGESGTRLGIWQKKTVPLIAGRFFFALFQTSCPGHARKQENPRHRIP